MFKSKQRNTKKVKQRQHNSSKSEQFHNGLKKLKFKKELKMILRVINKIKEDTNKQLNEFKNTNKYLSEFKKNTNKH